MSDLATLFATDPNKLTKDDIKEIIKAYRASRQQFNIGNVKAGKTESKKSPKEREIESVASRLGTDLSDLGL